jgi:hypothetical protein
VILLVVLGAVTIFSSRAQELCETLAREAFETVKNNCENIALGQACYGYDALDVTLTADAADARFNRPSDSIATSQLYTLRSAAFNEDEAEWGIGYFRLPLQVSQGQAGRDEALVITVVGDVLIENAAVSPNAANAAAASMYDLNFTTGGRSDCKATPNAVYIQAPKDVAVDLKINGTVMRVGTTIVLGTQTASAADSKKMWVAVMDGDLQLNPGSADEQTIAEGKYSSVPLDTVSADALETYSGEVIVGPDGLPFVRPMATGNYADPEIIDVNDSDAVIDFDSLAFVEYIPEELTAYEVDIPTTDDPFSLEDLFGLGGIDGLDVLDDLDDLGVLDELGTSASADDEDSDGNTASGAEPSDDDSANEAEDETSNTPEVEYPAVPLTDKDDQPADGGGDGGDGGDDGGGGEEP